MSMKNNHYIPQVYMKRVLEIRDESIYRYDPENKSWQSKKIDKIHANNSIYKLSKITADKYFGGDCDALEKKFSKFESEWARIWDNFEGTYPHEKSVLIMELHKHIMHRTPATLNTQHFLKEHLNKPFDTFDDAIGAMKNLSSPTAAKHSGEIVLNNMLRSMISPQQRINLTVSLLERETVILRFQNSMPLLLSPFLELQFFEIIDKENYHRSINSESQSKMGISIIQMSSLEWILLLDRKAEGRFMNGQQEKAFKIYRVPKYIEDDIRYTMVTNLAWSKNQVFGKKIGDFFYQNSYYKNRKNEDFSNLVGESLEISMPMWDKINRKISKLPNQWSPLFTDWFSNAMKILLKIQADLADFKK